MATLEQDAVEALNTAVNAFFKAHSDVRWIAIPMATYVVQRDPKHDAGYKELELMEKYNLVLPPLVVFNFPHDNKLLLAETLKKWANELPECMWIEGHEMAFGTKWTAGLFDTRTLTFDMPFYDGKAGVHTPTFSKTTIATKKREVKLEDASFIVLNTGGGLHYYPTSYPVTATPDEVDDAWVDFERRGCGYIRISGFVKGPITKYVPENE